MSGDVKEFYRRKLHEDITNLGIVNKTLKELAIRWDDKAEEIESIIASLAEFQALLTVEGHMGYHPKRVLEIVEVEEEDGKAIVEAAELAKEAEAKAEEKRIAAEIAKAKKLAEKQAKEEAAKIKAVEEAKAAKKAELEAKLAELEV